VLADSEELRKRLNTMKVDTAGELIGFGIIKAPAGSFLDINVSRRVSASERKRKDYSRDGV